MVCRTSSSTLTSPSVHTTVSRLLTSFRCPPYIRCSGSGHRENGSRFVAGRLSATRRSCRRRRLLRHKNNVPRESVRFAPLPAVAGFHCTEDPRVRFSSADIRKSVVLTHRPKRKAYTHKCYSGSCAQPGIISGDGSGSPSASHIHFHIVVIIIYSN